MHKKTLGGSAAVVAFFLIALPAIAFAADTGVTKLSPCYPGYKADRTEARAAYHQAIDDAQASSTAAELKIEKKYDKAVRKATSTYNNAVATAKADYAAAVKLAYGLSSATSTAQPISEKQAAINTAAAARDAALSAAKTARDAALLKATKSRTNSLGKIDAWYAGAKLQAETDLANALATSVTLYNACCKDSGEKPQPAE